MAVQRDINKEKLALKSYQSIYKKNPTTAEDWANLHRIAYPVSAGGLPDELKSTIDQSLYAGTGMASASGATAPTDINALRAGVDSAAANVQKTSQPNEALRILQEAIRAKSGQATQGIGENPLFKELGVTGMGALSQSIASQGAKLDMDFSNFQNIVSQMSGTYKDLAMAALNNYKIAQDRYKEEADKIAQAEKDLRDHAQAMELVNANFQNSLKLKQYENSHPGISAVITADSAGYEMAPNGQYRKKVNTIITSPSGDTYDIGKYAQLDDGTPNPEHITAMNDAYRKMGKLNSAADITNYINKYYPNSPITADAVINAAGKYGIDWETILATMAAETQMGTDGSKGAREFNFGNVGNTNTLMKSGGSKKLDGLQAGVDAVAKTLALPIYKRNQVKATSSTNQPSVLDVDTIEQMYFKGGTQAERDNRRAEIRKALATQSVEQYIATHPIGDQTKWQKNSEIFKAISTDSGWEAMPYEQRVKWIISVGGDPKDFESVLY